MVIEFSRNGKPKTVNYAELGVGATFYSPFRRGFYVVADEKDDDGDTMAMNVETGFLVGFEEDDEIIPVSMKAVVQGAKDDFR